MEFDLSSFDLESALSACQISDRHTLRNKFQRAVKQKPLNQSALINVLQAIDISHKKTRFRESLIQPVSYPSLPVSEKKGEVLNLIKDNQVVIIAGETGSGKTTQIPKICLEAGRGIHGLIGHTQPRRIAAKSVANRIAEELETHLGEKVGFKIRFNDQVKDKTLIKLMTDGILLAEIQHDKYLNAYDTIIIDEAHERSLNIDFLLGYLKRLLPKRPDLKVIITSATIDPQRFSRHFNNAPVIEISGRTYPVEIRYLDPADFDLQDDLELIGQAVEDISREPRGDILVFLSGERDIRDAADYLKRKQLKHTEILPLFARLSNAEQQKIFHPGALRRIVLATNVAETSLTVPGIKYVIDSGLARISRYSPRTKVQRLPIEAISQASANQRSGRCGRLSEGIAIRLYSKQDYESRDEFTDPEIVRTHLSSVILQMLSLGLGDVGKFPFIQSPDQKQINDGIKLLEELQAIERTRHAIKLTRIGRQMSRVPLDPRYARMLIEADKYGAVNEVLIIIAGLSIQDPRERPQEKQQQADTFHQLYADKDSDFISLLNLWNHLKQQQQSLTNNQLRKYCAAHFINFQRFREWQDIVSQIKQTLTDINLRITKASADNEAIHRSIIAGLLSQLGLKGNEYNYQGARSTQFSIFPGSSAFKQQPKWIMAAELVETTKLYARQVAKIKPDWIESCSAHLCKKHYTEPFWSKKQGSTQAHLNITLFGLPIVTKRIVDFSKIDQTVSRELFIREAMVNGLHNMRFAFLDHNQKQIDNVETIENKARNKDFLVEDEVLVDFYQEKIPLDICRISEFTKWWKSHQQKNPDWLNFNYEKLLKKAPEQDQLSQFPDFWQQGGLMLPLSYVFDPSSKVDGVSIRIPVNILNQVKNEGFDWLVAGLRYELLLHLIKSLPKATRRNFVPAPNFAKACLDIDTHDKNGNWLPVTEVLATKLFRMTGNKVSAEQFNTEDLPEFLKFSFICTDEQNKELGTSDKLVELQNQFAKHVKANLEKAAANDAIEKFDIEHWDFKTIPKVFKRKQNGFEITGYPALECIKGKINLTLFDNPQRANKAHVQGLIYLIKKNIPSPLKHLEQKLPNKAKLSMYFNPFGQIKMLIDDIAVAAIYSLCQQIYVIETVRNETQYKALLEHCRANLNQKALEIALQVEKGLATANKIAKQCKGSIPLNMLTNIANIKKYLQTLVYPGFVQTYGEEQLNDWNRYLHALLIRADKLKIDVNRDRQNQIEIDRSENLLNEAKNKLNNQDTSTENKLQEIAWMIEELKVSLFAQQLGTKVPVSYKRISNKVSEL